LREESKIPRQKAANDLSISRNSLEYYEKGKRTPDVGMLSRLAEYYSVSMDYLLGFSEYRNPENEKLVADLHLSDKTIELLKTNDGDFAKIVDMILSHDFELACNLLLGIQQYIEAGRMAEEYLRQEIIVTNKPVTHDELVNRDDLYRQLYYHFISIFRNRGLKQTQNAFTETIEEIAAENEGKSLFRHPALVIKKGEEE
ncbi:MAG: helix-turn-helix transcriptional regulator, partial [Clostridia bacterium]|nr:helix-turn-helix transcriptional regulator [Clostridia bacterium]